MEEEKKSCSCGCCGEAHQEYREHHHSHAHSHEHDHGCGCHAQEHDHDCACHEQEHHGHDHAHDHGCGCSCGCGHDHEHGGEIEREEVLPLAAGLILFFGGLLLPLPDVVKLGCYLAAYLISGWKVLLQAVKNISRGKLFDETFLMAVASLGACAIGEFSEGAAVMLFYNIGELLQDYAVGRSRKSIQALMDIRPDTANLLRGEEIVTVPAEQVEIGQSIVVRAGERVPLDGVVLSGQSQLDTSALTGESLPREIGPEGTVLAGCINQTGTLTVRVTKAFADSTASKILEMTEHASEKKAHTEQFITRFARYYTPIVVGAALLIAVVPPILGLGEWTDHIYRALTFLVVSCPCALVISVPLGFFAGIGRASGCGILVKGGNYLEALGNIDTIAFDKTGTLTAGDLSVLEICPAVGTAEDLLTLAALAEAHSTHPIALSLRKAYGAAPDRTRVSAVTELAGSGIRAVIDGRTILVGNARLMQGEKLSVPEPEETGTPIYLAADGVYQGYLLIGDRLKPTAPAALAELKRLGVRHTMMLTGDHRSAAESVGAQLEIDQICPELLPGDKLAHVEELLTKRQAGKESVVFIGDGINDAPVLARADVGIAMGGIGSDAAIEAADVVIMDDDLTKVAQAVKIARRTNRIIIENIVFSLGVKVLVLLITALGHGSMWAAVFADVGVCVIAVLNAMRLMLR